MTRGIGLNTIVSISCSMICAGTSLYFPRRRHSTSSLSLGRNPMEELSNIGQGDGLVKKIAGALSAISVHAGEDFPEGYFGDGGFKRQYHYHKGFQLVALAWQNRGGSSRACVCAC